MSIDLDKLTDNLYTAMKDVIAAKSRVEIKNDEVLRVMLRVQSFVADAVADLTIEEK